MAAQVKRLFGRCRIIGKRFPIVHVHADGALLEVSSFGTHADRARIPPDAAALLQRSKALARKVTPLHAYISVEGRRLMDSWHE